MAASDNDHLRRAVEVVNAYLQSAPNDALDDVFSVALRANLEEPDGAEELARGLAELNGIAVHQYKVRAQSAARTISQLRRAVDVQTAYLESDPAAAVDAYQAALRTNLVEDAEELVTGLAALTGLLLQEYRRNTGSTSDPILEFLVKIVGLSE